MDNSVKDALGRHLGFRCSECGRIVPSMWGDICNRCREEERRHNAMIDAIKPQAKLTALRKENARLRKALNSIVEAEERRVEKDYDESAVYHE